MRQEMNDQEAIQVNGGRYHLNKSNKKLYFDNISGVFTVKGSVYTAQELMDGLVGHYKTEAEYDAACVDILKANGLI